MNDSFRDRLSKRIQVFSESLEDDIVRILSKNGIIQSIRITEFTQNQSWPHHLIMDALSNKFGLGTIESLSEFKVLAIVNKYDSVLVGETDSEILVDLIKTENLEKSRTNLNNEAPAKNPEPPKLRPFAEFMPIPKV